MTLTPPWLKALGPFPSLFQSANWVRAKFLLAMGSLNGWSYNSITRGSVPLTIITSGDASPLQKPGYLIEVVDLTTGQRVVVPQPLDSPDMDLNAYLTYLITDEIQVTVSLIAVNLPSPTGMQLAQTTVQGQSAANGVTVDVTLPDFSSGVNVTVTSSSGAQGYPVNVNIYNGGIEVLTQLGSMIPASSGSGTEFVLHAPDQVLFAADDYTVIAQITTPNGNFASAENTVTGAQLSKGISLAITIPKAVQGGLPVEVVQQQEVNNISVYVPVQGALVSATATDTNGTVLKASGTSGQGGLLTLVFSNVDSSQTYKVVVTATLPSEQGATGSATLPALSGSVLAAGTDATLQVAI